MKKDDIARKLEDAGLPYAESIRWVEEAFEEMRAPRLDNDTIVAAKPESVGMRFELLKLVTTADPNATWDSTLERCEVLLDYVLNGTIQRKAPNAR